MALLRLPVGIGPRRALLAGAAALALLLVVVASLLAWQARRAQPAAAQPHFVELAEGVYILPKPDALAAFRLVNHDGAPFDNASLQGRWSFVVFGYTFCPDFCPTTLAEFAHTHRLLAQHSEGVRDVQFLMVSVDPARDTPQLLQRYVPQFNRDFIGVTGDAAVIARLADSVGAVYNRVPGSSDDTYLIDHSSAVLLINPQGELQGIFAAPHAAKTLASGFHKIRERVRADARSAG
jgi:protein SCO1/2